MNNSPDVIVVGLGYIGLPTATLIASKNISVMGVDINENVVNDLNHGEIHIIEKDLEREFKKALNEGLFYASTQPISAGTYIVVVPTPFKKNKKPNISFVESATRKIIPLLKKGDLFIIESTSPVGTTEKMMNLIYKERPDLKDNLHIAYCPERVLPGNIMFELVNNDRVIGGVNESSTKKAISFYKKFVKGKLHATDSKTAEMCKLIENSSRDVQISFANELSIICDKMGINVWSLINLANMHPRVNILSPGCGVGGHCIAVDPYFIISDFPDDTKIISSARQINNYKTIWCIEKINNAKLQFQIKNGKKPTIAIMGLAFKPNIDDLRESPAKIIAKSLLEENPEDKYFIVEPNIKTHNYFEVTDYQTAIQKSDIIVFLVAHNEFKNLKLPKNKNLIDFCGVLHNNNNNNRN